MRQRQAIYSTDFGVIAFWYFGRKIVNPLRSVFRSAYVLWCEHRPMNNNFLLRLRVWNCELDITVTSSQLLVVTSETGSI